VAECVCKPPRMSRPVSVILLFAPTLAKPYPLIPAEDYSVCLNCDAIFTFISKAQKAHPLVREAGDWTRAIVVYSDGHGCDVKARRPEMAKA
jgi:hypothetical protein